MTARVYRFAPNELRIGPGAADGLPEVVAELGGSPLVVADTGGRAVAGDVLGALAKQIPETQVDPFAGECTADAIGRLAEAARGRRVLVGVGGGKALDAAKAAAVAARVPCVTVPTSAATCAAYTPLSILHEASGSYVESRRLPRPVAACLIDVDRIVTAPPRLLAAGIVDALARAFDTILAARIGVPTATASFSLAVCREFVERTLLPLGARALADNTAGEPTDAFTRVVEASIVGAGLAGETGARFFGRSFSHAVAYALSDVVDPDDVLHGEAAGLGILVHAVLDPEPPVPLDALRDHFAAWGVPVSFAKIDVAGIDGPDGARLASRTLNYLDRERAVPFPVDASDLHRAMITVDTIGTRN